MISITCRCMIGSAVGPGSSPSYSFFHATIILNFLWVNSEFVSMPRNRKDGMLLSQYSERKKL